MASTRLTTGATILSLTLLAPLVGGCDTTQNGTDGDGTGGNGTDCPTESSSLPLLSWQYRLSDDSTAGGAGGAGASGTWEGGTGPGGAGGDTSGGCHLEDVPEGEQLVCEGMATPRVGTDQARIEFGDGSQIYGPALGLPDLPSRVWVRYLNLVELFAFRGSYTHRSLEIRDAPGGQVLALTSNQSDVVERWIDELLGLSMQQIPNCRAVVQQPCEVVTWQRYDHRIASDPDVTLSGRSTVQVDTTQGRFAITRDTVVVAAHTAECMDVLTPQDRDFFTATWLGAELEQ